MLQENNLLSCLDIGLKKNLPPSTRQRIVAKSAEWGMLERPWKSLLLIAINEIQIPGDDEATSGQSMIRTRRGGRNRRGGKSNAGPMEWLPKASDVLISDGSPEAYRLAILLIRKTLFEDDWDESWDSILNDLRESANAEGVHPVWQKMAEATPILAQFAAFPAIEVSEETETSLDLSKSWIDPNNSEALASVISSYESKISDAKIRAALKKAWAQLNGKRGLKDIEGLDDLKGESSVISALLKIHLGMDCKDSLKELSKHDKKLSEALSDLVNLRNNDAKNWNKSRSIKPDNELSQARIEAAWNIMPDEAAELSSDELDFAISIVKSPQDRERLVWWKLSSLIREDSLDTAVELLVSLKIDQNTDIESLIPVVKKLGVEAVDWLSSQVSNLDTDSLSQILTDTELRTSLRLAAARKLHDSESSSHMESLIELFSEGLDLTRLAEILLVDLERCADYPYATLLVSHLLPANIKGWDFETIRKARSSALSTVESAEVPESFSAVSKGLILMLDGAAQLDDDWVVDTLDKPGLKAFNNCKQALKDGGDGLADSKVLDTLAKSVSSAELSDIESRLFNAVIDTLRLNRASWLLQTGKSKGVVDLLDGLLSGEVTAMPMMQAVKHLVLEYDIGLPNLVSWYQENDPQSPWHTLARAGVYVANKDELNAARDYKRAGDHPSFDYEHKITLYRKSLIHLAHAEQWSEAVALLEQEPALKSALTKRFQLYLNVSNLASNNKTTDDATRVLRNFVKRTVTVQQEDQHGNLKPVKKNRHSEEELDLLRNYPNSHPRPLPREPFTGRVKAATNTLQRERRQDRRSFENRYAQAMMHDPSTSEIYDIANEASMQKPLEGLMLLERAQNSGKFSLVDMKRLADAERALYAKHHHNLAIKQRSYLRNLALTPLVIIDTNILIDELQYRISQKLGISYEASLDVGGKGRFHRVLKHRSDEGVIQIWLPKIVQDELYGIASDGIRIRERFLDTLVSPVELESVLNKKSLKEIVSGIISDFSNWKPLDLHLEDEIGNEEVKENLKQFMLEHSDVYDEITAMKRLHNEKIRNIIDGRDIYPEKADQKIMCLASVMAERSLKDLGSILIATRDSDFTLVARSIEERFGFGVIANSRDLNSWLR